LCRKCVEDIPVNDPIETTYIQSIPSNNVSDDDSNGRPEGNEDDSISSSEMEDPYDEEEALCNFLNEINQNQNSEEENNVQSDDSNGPDFDADEFEQDPNQEENDVPTTNASDFVHTITGVTTYGGSFGNITISGHVLLNQCGTLLTRKNIK
jgi:hypothetical protein